MSLAQQHTIASYSNMPENWQPVKRETFTDNDVLEAYMYGKQVGKNEKERIINEIIHMSRLKIFILILSLNIH